MSPFSAPSGYRPALDGIRAISVITIILVHFPVTWLRGGTFSVNVFFVLSGYLITGLLLKEYDRWGSIDLFAFYGRRAKRLFPALILMVLAVIIAIPLILGGRTPGTIKNDALASLFYVANWRFISSDQSYFTQFDTPSPFRHMWTLAIEEQYYIIFPLVLIGLLTLWARKRWAVVGAVGLLALASAASMAAQFTPGQDPSRVYYGTDTRMQDILVGCLVALIMWALRPATLRRLSKRQAALGALGVTMFVSNLVWFVGVDGDWIYRGGYLLFDLTVALLVVSVELAPSQPMARMLAWRPIAWIGELSYGLYLWHWPTFIVLDTQRTGLSGLPLLAVRLAVTVGLACLSFYLVENPIRRGALSTRLRSPAIVWATVAAFALTAGITNLATANVSPMQNVRVGDVRTVTAKDAPVGAPLGRGSRRLLIVGDSVGFSLGYNFPSKDFPNVQPTAEVQFGCGTAEQSLAFNGMAQPTTTEQCANVFASWSAGVTKIQPDAIVWSLGGWEVFDHFIDGKVLEVGSPEYRDYLLGRLDLGLKALDGTRAPVIIPNVPCYHQPTFVVAGDDLAPDRNDPARAKAVNAILTEFAKRHPDRVHIANTFGFLCPTGTFQPDLDGVFMRDDGVHYTAEGAQVFWKWLMPQIDPLWATQAQP